MTNILITTLFLAAYLERTLFDLGPNVELLTTALILGSVFLPKKLSIWAGLLTVIFSDLVIGNTSIFIFTWSAWLGIALVSTGLFQRLNLKGITRGAVLTLTGLGANLVFYLWTNFGVWLLDAWGMYPNTAYGLVQSYLNGLPFLKLQLLSTLVFLPVALVIVEAVNYTVFSLSKVRRVPSELPIE